MATETICDGCGERSRGKKFSAIGILVPREYCPACAPVVEEYISARNRLQEQLAQDWATGCEAIRSDALAERPSMELPDDF